MFQASCVILLLFLHDVVSQAGDPCSTKAGQPGKCANIRQCQAAIDDIKRRINPQICGFDGPDPIVCCASTTPPAPVLTTTQRINTPPPYIPQPVTYVDSQSDCEPLSPERTAPRNGKKAWDKCIEYQEKYIYPCEQGAALIGDLVRGDHCGHGGDELIIGGEETTPREFPHMVLLGFGPTADSASWQCGGSIISEWYILTAGHCTSNRGFGDVTFARIGVLKRNDQINPDSLYSIAQIVKHPLYRSPAKYNDVALLRTDRMMSLSQWAVPACLHTGEAVREDKALATGWGSTKNRGPLANSLLKVTLEKFTTPECKVKYPVGTRNLEQGFNENTQICYGSRLYSNDTCQGDSGGPLQGKSRRLQCMYTLIGVTSFGRKCGVAGEPAIYTRVAAFTDWIESVVWP